MLTIDASSGKKPIDAILREHDLILSREIIHCVCDAMDMGLPQILIATVKLPIGFCDYYIQAFESHYKVCLEKNINVLIAAEEYELCAKAIDYINRIDEMHLIEV
jgi:hypothetical protein